MQPLADNTGGNFYFASDANQLSEIYASIQRKIDIDTDSDKDGLPDYYEEHFPMFNGKCYALKKDDPDTDKDTIPDGEEVQLRKIYDKDKTKVCVIGKILSDPCDGDRDHDGVLDINDPKPLEHFGRIEKGVGRGVVLFEKADRIEMPYNSKREEEIGYALDGYTYQNAFKTRAAEEGINVDSWLDVTCTLNLINIKAWTLAEGGRILGDDVWYRGETFSNVVTLTEIYGFADFFLRNYLCKTGLDVQYNARDLLTTMEDGKNIYKKCVEYTMAACENSLKKNGKIVFKQTDGAARKDDVYITEQRYVIEMNDLQRLKIGTSFQQWLALNRAFSAMAGECTYDGEYYNLELTYFIQDYYDWYYEDEGFGKQRLLLVTCDEMCWLHLFDMAKNFNTDGIYRVNIRWKKGETYEEAKQTEHDFYAYRD